MIIKLIITIFCAKWLIGVDSAYAIKKFLPGCKYGLKIHGLDIACSKTGCTFKCLDSDTEYKVNCRRKGKWSTLPYCAKMIVKKMDQKLIEKYKKAKELRETARQISEKARKAEEEARAMEINSRLYLHQQSNDYDRIQTPPVTKETVAKQEVFNPSTTTCYSESETVTSTSSPAKITETTKEKHKRKHKRVTAKAPITKRSTKYDLNRAQGVHQFKATADKRMTTIAYFPAHMVSTKCDIIMRLPGNTKCSLHEGKYFMCHINCHGSRKWDGEHICLNGKWKPELPYCVHKASELGRSTAKIKYKIESTAKETSELGGRMKYKIESAAKEKKNTKVPKRKRKRPAKVTKKSMLLKISEGTTINMRRQSYLKCRVIMKKSGLISCVMVNVTIVCNIKCRKPPKVSGKYSCSAEGEWKPKLPHCAQVVDYEKFFKRSG